MSYSLYVAVLLLVGIAGGKVSKRLGLPSVTGYILFGLALGPSFLNFITPEIYKNISFVNDIALGILAITIGAELHVKVLKKYGKNLAIISAGNVALTIITVTLATWLLGLEFKLAIILGALATSVSPSGVVSMIKETKSSGEFTQNLLGMVALDNLLCIITFGIVVAIVESLGVASISGFQLAFNVFKDIALAILLGVASGYFISRLIKKQTKKNTFLVILIGVFLLNTGLAVEFNLSAILANMAMGTTISNITNRKLVLSSTLDRIEMPIFVLFLTLAGAKLDLSVVKSVGVVGVGYIVARMFGKYVGAYLFSQPTSISKKVKKNLGLGLLPQAGVAIGLAIIAEQKIPSATGTITGVILTGVIFFEIFGPLLLGRAIKNVGESRLEQ